MYASHQHPNSGAVYLSSNIRSLDNFTFMMFE